MPPLHECSLAEGGVPVHGGNNPATAPSASTHSGGTLAGPPPGYSTPIVKRVRLGSSVRTSTSTGTSSRKSEGMRGISSFSSRRHRAHSLTPTQSLRKLSAFHDEEDQTSSQRQPPPFSGSPRALPSRQQQPDESPSSTGSYSGSLNLGPNQRRATRSVSAPGGSPSVVSPGSPVGSRRRPVFATPEVSSVTTPSSSVNSGLPYYQQQTAPWRFRLISLLRGGSSFTFNASCLVQFAVLVVILVVLLDTQKSLAKASEQLSFYTSEEERVKSKINKFQARGVKLSAEIDRLREENNKMEELKKLGEVQQSIEERRHNDEDARGGSSHDDFDSVAIQKRIDLLRERIQSESRRAVVNRYGQGPKYRVEIGLEFTGQPERDDQGNSLPNKIHVETAPLDLSPHAVYLFLEQVGQGLWDGAAFVWKSSGVVLASPNDSGDESVREGRRDAFAASGYETVSFQEYSEEFPHRQYTLGFAGRPLGGPDFYINMQDNTVAHGPSGGGARVGKKEGSGGTQGPDPCFAEVVAGFEALKRIYDQPTEDDKDGAKFHSRIVIRYAKVLTENR